MTATDRTPDEPERPDLRPEPAPHRGWRITEAAERVIALWRGEDPYDGPLPEAQPPELTREGP